MRAHSVHSSVRNENYAQEVLNDSKFSAELDDQLGSNQLPYEEKKVKKLDNEKNKSKKTKRKQIFKKRDS